MPFQNNALLNLVAGEPAAREPWAERRRRRYERALTLGIPLIYALMGLVCLNRIGPRDFDQFLVFHEIQYWNSALFGLAKQWTPLLCSGLSAAGEPQIPFLSLSMLLSYLWEPLRGLQAAIVLYFIAGWAGGYLYAGLWTDERRTRLLAASLFIGNGFFFCRLGYGHVDFIPFLTLPLMLWVLHRCLSMHFSAGSQTPLSSNRSVTGFPRLLALISAILLLGGGISLIVDGSPVSILHLLFWITLYTLTLSVVARDATPTLVLLFALALASILDAGYLWPMVASQTEFPRHTPDSLTNPLALIWFMLLPLQGKVIEPAAGNGHEMSVYIGPVLAYAIWRFRASLWTEWPAHLKWPLLIVCAVSLVLGIGSLRMLHVPALLSPFDALRPLPGFRSMGVTGRYWGVFALPLSLLAAAAFRRLLSISDGAGDRASTWQRHGLPIAALLLQFGFQAGTLISNWLPGRPYEPVDFRNAFSPDGADINYVYCKREYQGVFIRPTQGVIDCYDNDDFTRAAIAPGTQLARAIIYSVAGRQIELSISARAPTSAAPATARFLSWNSIRLTAAIPPPQSNDTQSLPSTQPAPVTVALNQAYNRHWTAADCAVVPGAGDDLQVTCGAARWQQGPVELRFYDPVSDQAARVSVLAWKIWLGTMAALAVWILISRTGFSTRWSRSDPARWK